MNFWQKLKKPIIVLAPMADVTDRAFRQIIAKYGKPDVIWTEFVSADGLFRGGYDALINDLAFENSERPIVVQFFTSSPEMMKEASKLAVKLGFDGIDINMGCPDKGVEKQGAGASLIRTPALAREIIRSAKEGAGDVPVSVKTRIGWNKNELEVWLREILAENPAVVTIHARTRKELSLVSADWSTVKRAVEIRDEMKSNALIFGNGDVTDVEHAEERVRETGCDGVMIGRGIFGKPWLFANLSRAKRGRQIEHPAEALLSDVASVSQVSKSVDDEGRLTEMEAKVDKNGAEPDLTKRLSILVEHTKLFETIVGPKPPVGQGKSFAIMKKHFKAYVTGFDGSKELRMKLMNAENAEDVEEIVNEFKSHF